MKITKLIEFNKYKGICEVCGEPLGEIQEERGTFFCYKCAGFNKLDINRRIDQINEKLLLLRDKFKKSVLNGYTDKYFCNYLTLGEAIFNTDSIEYCAQIPDSNEEVVHINFLFFVIANIALKWILEDLNLKTNDSNVYSKEIFGIPIEWQSEFLKKIYLKNGLGFFIKKDDKEVFYFTQMLDYYHQSLNSFGLIEPNQIPEEKKSEIIDILLEKEKDEAYIQRIINFDLPLFFVCMSYLQYPNIEDRIFTFEDILFDPSVIQIISDIQSYYKDKRPTTPKECEDGQKYFIVKKIEDLRNELSHIKWNETLEHYIIASKSNPLSFPLLIKYKDDIVITPTRLKIAYEMMFEYFVHNMISSTLSRIFEENFQNTVKDTLKEHFDIIDPFHHYTWENIIDKKNNTFEIDIIGYKEDYIIVIECKSFHPTPFFHLKDARKRREEQFNHYVDKFNNNIKPWLIESLKNKPKKGLIKINCRKIMKNRKSNKFVLNFLEKFHLVDENHILGLYITQINENFTSFSNIIQVYFEELVTFLKIFDNP